jgi:hypothetical protein
MSMTEGTQAGGEGSFVQPGRISGPDTGGVDIGSWGGVGGRIPGLNAISAAAADVGAGAAAASLKRKAAKDYNDQPASTTVGADGNQAVKEPPDLGGDI